MIHHFQRGPEPLGGTWLLLELDCSCLLVRSLIIKLENREKLPPKYLHNTGQVGPVNFNSTGDLQGSWVFDSKQGFFLE